MIRTYNSTRHLNLHKVSQRCKNNQINFYKKYKKHGLELLEYRQMLKYYTLYNNRYNIRKTIVNFLVGEITFFDYYEKFHKFIYTSNADEMMIEVEFLLGDQFKYFKYKSIYYDFTILLLNLYDMTDHFNEFLKNPEYLYNEYKIQIMEDPDLSNLSFNEFILQYDSYIFTDIEDFKLSISNELDFITKLFF